MSQFPFHVVAACVVALTPTLCAAQCQYEIAHIIEGPFCPFFGTPTPKPQAINDHNAVVGYYSVCNIGNDRAFYWSEATGLVTLQFPFPIFESRAYDINNEGMIAGVYSVAGSGLGNQAFIMRADGTDFQFLGILPGGDFSEALAINDAGQVTGYADSLTSPTVAIIWEDGVMTNLAPTLGTLKSRGRDINNEGWVTGWMGTNQFMDAVAFITDGETVVNLGSIPGGMTADGRAITSLLTVAGYGLVPQVTGDVFDRPFFASGAKMVALAPYPGSADCIADALDTNGAAMGWCGVPSNVGVVWKDGGMTLLADLVCAEGTLEVSLIRDVNSTTGTIVGNGTLNDVDGGMLFVPVRLIADLDGDGLVNGADLGILLLNWMTTRIESDLNEDGLTDGQDLGILLLHWTR